MKNKNGKNMMYGIQRKVLLYSMGIVSVVLLLVAAGVGAILTRNTSHSLTEQYSYVNEKLFTSFLSTYEELDKIMENCVMNDYIQKSLCSEPLGANDAQLMMQGLSFLNKSYMDYYLFIDNKKQIYAQKSIELDQKNFYQSELYKKLGNEYSKTKLLWQKDIVFGSNEMALFTGRKIHQIDRVHEPGVMYIRLNMQVFQNIFQVIEDEKPIYLMLDPQKQICYEKTPQAYPWKKGEKEAILEKCDSNAANIGKTGLICSKTDAETGFTIVTYVPKEILGKARTEMKVLLTFVFLLALGIAFAASMYLSNKMTKPIKMLNALMISFDDSNLSQTISIHTNTELDSMGDAYNKMLGRIGHLMQDTQKKERDLRVSELNLLLYQIRPHFLYNTLDTIYMLARISKEETIMKMIQALSKFLRINLSNGENQITVAKELEHVSAYLDIQQIRNSDLFVYTVTCPEELKKYKIQKMLLQPLAENSIKYGFCDCLEGGEITISVSEETEYIVLSVSNNGKPMREEKLRELNQLEHEIVKEIEGGTTKQEGGYGLRNVVKRLRLQYHDQIRFYYTQQEDRTVCVIKISKNVLSKSGEEGESR